MLAVAHDARASRPTKDGSTQRAHWQAAAQRGSRVAQQALEGPPFPESLGYLYDWFVALSAARREGLNGPAALTHQDIAAWASLMDERPAPHEVEALLLLDLTWRQAWSEQDATPEADVDPMPAPKPAWPTKSTKRATDG